MHIPGKRNDADLDGRAHQQLFDHVGCSSLQGGKLVAAHGRSRVEHQHGIKTLRFTQHLGFSCDIDIPNTGELHEGR